MAYPENELCAEVWAEQTEQHHFDEHPATPRAKAYPEKKLAMGSCGEDALSSTTPTQVPKVCSTKRKAVSPMTRDPEEKKKKLVQPSPGEVIARFCS